MLKKLIVDDSLPTERDSYESCVQFLLDYRKVWTIKDTPRRSLKDFRKPNSGQALTKWEILEFIRETFQSTADIEEEKSKKYNEDLKGGHYVYEIEYIGEKNLVRLELEDGPSIVLNKGIPIPVYEKDCHLLEIARKDTDNFLVIARDWYGAEEQLIETYRTVRDKNRFVPRANKFFEVF